MTILKIEALEERNLLTGLPYGGVPWAVPGTIQAENFDLGAAGVGYLDSTTGNTGGQYRQTNVDIQGTGDAGGGYNVGWTKAGEWLAYTINVSKSGTYTFEARVASPGVGGNIQLQDETGKPIGSVLSIPNTGAWQAFSTISQNVTLPAGLQTVRIAMLSAGASGDVGNLNWIRFTEPGVAPSQTPLSGQPLTIPGTIQAEDFDNGGRGLAFADTSAGNSGNAYRQTDVDIQTTSDTGGGHNIGWTKAGEWLEYTVNVATAGRYTFEARVASAGNGGTIQLQDETGKSLGTALTVPNTGGWDRYTTIRSTVDLTAGRQVIRLAFLTNGGTGDVGNVNWLRLTSAIPPLTAVSGGSYTGSEGTTITLAGSASGGVSPYSYAWDLDNNGTFETTGQSASVAFPDNGTYTVGMRVTDASGASSTATSRVEVGNVAPTLRPNGTMNATLGITISMSGIATDPSSIDTAAGFRYTWNFGDGSTEVTGMNLSTTSHTYSAPGNYTVTLTATDKDGGLSNVSTTVFVATPSNSAAPLLTQSDIQYVGSFRVPGGVFGASEFDYGGTALAYNPARNSLFIVGHAWKQAIAEISIPTDFVDSSDIRTMKTAQVLQPFTQVLNKLQVTDNVNAIGGLMVYDGKLVASAFNTYATGSVKLSHFTLNSLNLASAAVEGLFQVGDLGDGLVGGYMAPVPTEWQAALGAKALTGQGAISIISRSSSGPAAFGFDPGTLGPGINNATPYVYYNVDNQNLGSTGSSAPTLFNGTVGTFSGSGFGLVFVPETRSVLFFGAIGTGPFYYGEAADANDPYRLARGAHSVGGGYTFQVWAYNVEDFISVKNGEQAPWDLKPYSSWAFDVPGSTGAKYVGGVAFDPTTQRIFMVEMGADKIEEYSSRPLVRVFQINTGDQQTGGLTGSAYAEVSPSLNPTSLQLSPTEYKVNGLPDALSIQATPQQNTNSRSNTREHRSMYKVTHALTRVGLSHMVERVRSRHSVLVKLGHSKVATLDREL